MEHRQQAAGRMVHRQRVGGFAAFPQLPLIERGTGGLTAFPQLLRDLVEIRSAHDAHRHMLMGQGR